METHDVTHEPLKVLVVDDEPVMLEVVGGMLLRAMPDTRVTYASDAETALQRVEKDKPNLVVLGVFLDDSSKTGFEILEEVRASGDDVPVVLMSGSEAAALEAAERWLPCYSRVSFLPKPFTRDELVEAVRLVLSQEAAP